MGWLGSFAHRIKLTIDSSKVDETLSKFPVLICLSSESGITDADVTTVFDELGSYENRKKIAITASDGTTQRYIEIESWDHASEVAYLWVKVTSVSAVADDELYLYFDSEVADNDTYVGETLSTPAQNVWAPSHLGVWHMAQDPNGDVASSIKDSTSNLTHGTPSGSMTTADLVDGLAGKAIEFDNSDDYINLTNSSLFNFERTNSITISVTFKCPSTTSWEALVCRGASSGSLPCWQLIKSNTHKIYFALIHGAGNFLNAYGTAIIDDNTWKKITVTYDGSSTLAGLKFYVNGALDTKTSTTSTLTSSIQSNYELLFGSLNKLYYLFPGTIDEVRISGEVKTAAWIKASYYSDFDNLVTFSSEESSSSSSSSSSRSSSSSSRSSSSSSSSHSSSSSSSSNSSSSSSSNSSSSSSSNSSSSSSSSFSGSKSSSSSSSSFSFSSSSSSSNSSSSSSSSSNSSSSSSSSSNSSSSSSSSYSSSSSSSSRSSSSSSSSSQSITPDKFQVQLDIELIKSSRVWGYVRDWKGGIIKRKCIIIISSTDGTRVYGQTESDPNTGYFNLSVNLVSGLDVLCSCFYEGTFHGQTNLAGALYLSTGSSSSSSSRSSSSSSRSSSSSSESSSSSRSSSSSSSSRSSSSSSSSRSSSSYSSSSSSFSVSSSSSSSRSSSSSSRSSSSSSRSSSSSSSSSSSRSSSSSSSSRSSSSSSSSSRSSSSRSSSSSSSQASSSSSSSLSSSSRSSSSSSSSRSFSSSSISLSSSSSSSRSLSSSSSSFSLSLSLGVCATWNPLDKSANITLSNGDLTASVGSVGNSAVRATESRVTGKWYWEITCNTDGKFIGIGNSSANLGNYVGSDANGWGYENSAASGRKHFNGSYSVWGNKFTTGDIIGIALNLDTGKIWWSKNGVWQNSGDPAAGTNEAFSGISGTIFPMISLSYGASITANFGGSAFSYSIPSGFDSYCIGSSSSSSASSSSCAHYTYDSYFLGASTDGQDVRRLGYIVSPYQPWTTLFEADPLYVGETYGDLYGIYLRFTNVTIEQGESIQEALISLTADSDSYLYTSRGIVQAYIYNIDDADVPSGLVGDLDLTSIGAVSYDIPTVEGASGLLDVTSGVQAIVSRSGFSSGNSIGIFLLPTKDDKYYRHYIKNYGVSGEPELQVLHCSGSFSSSSSSASSSSSSRSSSSSSSRSSSSRSSSSSSASFASTSGIFYPSALSDDGETYATTISSVTVPVVNSASGTFTGSPSMYDRGAVSASWTLTFFSSTQYSVSGSDGTSTTGDVSTTDVYVGSLTYPKFHISNSQWGGAFLPGDTVTFTTTAAIYDYSYHFEYDFTCAIRCGKYNNWIKFNCGTMTGSSIVVNSAFIRVTASADSVVASQQSKIVGYIGPTIPSSGIDFDKRYEIDNSGTEYVYWTIPEFAKNSTYDSPDLAAIMNERMGSWISGGSFIFLIRNNRLNNEKEFYGWHNTALYAQLHVAWSYA